MRTHNLGSVNAVRNSLKQLELLDYIEKAPDGVWHVIDPGFYLVVDSENQRGGD